MSPLLWMAWIPCLVVTVYPVERQLGTVVAGWWGCGRVLVATWPARPVWRDAGHKRRRDTVRLVRRKSGRPRCGNLTSPNGPQPAQPPAQLSWSPASTRTIPLLSWILLAGVRLKCRGESSEYSWGGRGWGGISHHICPDYKLLRAPHTATHTLSPSQRYHSRRGCHTLASVCWEEIRGEERLLRLARWAVLLAGWECREWPILVHHHLHLQSNQTEYQERNLVAGKCRRNER